MEAESRLDLSAHAPNVRFAIYTPSQLFKIIKIRNLKGYKLWLKKMI